MHSKVAVITGTSSGFGLLACVELARRGFRVFATLRSPERSSRLDAALAEANLSVEKVQLDVADGRSIRSMVEEVTARAGRIDVLVNNAGYGVGGFVEDLSMEELRSQFETNFFGAVELTKLVIPGMRERREGRIINISSLSGRIGFAGFGAYCASKFAMEGLSEALRHELLPYNVYVSLVLPGIHRTDIFEKNRRMAARALVEGSPNLEATRKVEAVVMAQVFNSKADPRGVARLIAEVATARRPQLRYIIGRDARLGAFFNALLPSSLWESIWAFAIQRTPVSPKPAGMQPGSSSLGE